jgi:hypothetical protein
MDYADASVSVQVGEAGSAVVGKPPNMVQVCGRPAVTCYDPQIVFVNMLEHLREKLGSCPQPMIIHPRIPSAPHRRPLRSVSSVRECNGQHDNA